MILADPAQIVPSSWVIEECDQRVKTSHRGLGFWITGVFARDPCIEGDRELPLRCELCHRGGLMHVGVSDHGCQRHFYVAFEQAAQGGKGFGM